MSTGKYVLNEDGEPQREDDLMKWADWFEDAQRGVGMTRVGEYGVSTIFLGLDHGFGSPIPILWETMVFDAKGKSVDMERCGGSREQAEAMHEEMVRKYALNSHPVGVRKRQA